MTDVNVLHTRLEARKKRLPADSRKLADKLRRRARKRLKRLLERSAELFAQPPAAFVAKKDKAVRR